MIYVGKTGAKIENGIIVGKAALLGNRSIDAPVNNDLSMNGYGRRADAKLRPDKNVRSIWLAACNRPYNKATVKRTGYYVKEYYEKNQNRLKNTRRIGINRRMYKTMTSYQAYIDNARKCKCKMDSRHKKRQKVKA